MNKKILALLLYLLTNKVSCAGFIFNEPVIGFCPGTPPPRSMRVADMRHEPDSVGYLEWSNDITDRLSFINRQLPPDSRDQAFFE